MLRYGMPYHAETADRDVGVPLVLEFDVSKEVKRATVAKCYDQIFRDLDSAEELLGKVSGKPDNRAISSDACEALRARVYLEMKLYDRAYTAASHLISSGRYPLEEPQADNFVQMWRHDTSDEFILILPMVRNEETAYYFGDYYGLDSDNHRYSPEFIPTQGILDLFSTEDLRRAVYFEKENKRLYYDNTYFTGVSIISKFKGNPELAYIIDDPVYGAIPNNEQMPKIFRIPEQYLIMAEAAYHMGNDALTPLNALRVSRGLQPIPASVSGIKLFQEIKNERTRELAFEGFRLFDLRRWGDPMVRMTPQVDDQGDSNFLAQQKELLHLNIPAGDHRFIFPIPQNDINVYGKDNMPQNPGW